MEVAVPKLAALVVAAASLSAVTGCQVAPDTRADHRAAEPAPYMTLDEFASVVAGKGEVTLVEFCVPTGCARCDEMRHSIDQLAIDQLAIDELASEGLANDRREQITVRRMNLRQYPALAWEFGVTVCPSYVAFRDGEEVFRAAHPTSADLIVSSLEEALHGASTDQLSLAD